MISARAKRILQLALSPKQLEATDDDISNPDKIMFIQNQFPKSYEGASISSNSDVPSMTLDTPLLSNDLTVYEIISDEAQPYVAPTNQSELENSPSILNQQEPQLQNDLQPQINLILITNNDECLASNVQFQYIDQYVPMNIPQQDEIIINEPTVEVIESTTSSLLKNMTRLVDYSDSTDSECAEPVVKRKKRCQVKNNEWNVEKNRLKREKGNEYYGKRKEAGNWVKDIRKPKNRDANAQNIKED